jgi:hypothetical protein
MVEGKGKLDSNKDVQFCTCMNGKYWCKVGFLINN